MFFYLSVAFFVVRIEPCTGRQRLPPGWYQGNFYYRPFNKYVKKLINGRPNFFLKNIPEEYIIFKDPHIYVIDCNKLSKGLSKDALL